MGGGQIAGFAKFFTVPVVTELNCGSLNVNAAKYPVYLWGVATGGRLQVDFLWSKNDVKTAIEHEYYTSPKKFYTPQTNFWLRPWSTRIYGLYVAVTDYNH